MIDSDSDILCQREMNEWNFVACGTKIGGNLGENIDGISYVNLGGKEPNPKINVHSMVLLLQFLW